MLRGIRARAGVDELATGLLADDRAELLHGLQMLGDLRDGPETTHALKLGQRDGDFRLVVVVWVVLGVARVQLLRQRLVRVSLIV